MASWEEVKRLASDFQKVQLSSTAQRLSERNCIEIVSWLINKNLIELIFTSDGKEYMTPKQLTQDILGELYVNGGRVNFVELSKAIGVDLSHITTHANSIARNHKNIHLILGQLIDNVYIAKIAGEINEKLIQLGQVNVSDLTLQYDLPAEFLQQRVIEKNLGKIIHAEQDKSDSKTFFTQSFIARSKAKIRGALMGLTRPMSVSTILNHIGVSEKLFFSLFDQSTMYGFLTSRLSGAMYVPNVYSRTQNEWVNNFYKQNGYIEFDALIRLGITDAKTYLKKQFANEDVVYLNTCIVSQSIEERIQADVDECISSKSYVDLQNNLPSVFNDDDIKSLIEKVFTSQKYKQMVVIDNFIISKAFLDDLIKCCETFIQQQATHIVESGKYQQFQTELQISKTHKGDVDVEVVKIDKRDERRKKAAGGKSGGGTQGRETKTKSTKKPSKVSKTIHDNDDDDYQVREKKATLEIITLDDVKRLIQSKLEQEGLDEILESIANHLLPSLNESGLETATKLYATTISDRTATRRNTHNDVQNKLNTMLGDVRLFEKGLKLLPVDVQPQLYKYLLKTVCTDTINEVLNYLASEEGLNSLPENFTNEQRLKFINDLPAEYKGPLQTAVKTLSGQNIEEFMAASEECLTACSMILKKIDKKKDRVVILNHKHGLLEQLDKCEDPALTLHLTTLIIFITATQNILHASGRHVASILAFLKQYLTVEQLSELTAYHDLVTLVLVGGSDVEGAKDQLKEKISIIKTIAIEYKKTVPDKN